MKIAIIDIGWNAINQYNPFSDALGGSETWLFQISNKFSEKNTIHVYFNFKDNALNSRRVNDNLVYFNARNTLEMLKNIKYDFVILSRFVAKNGVNYIDYIQKNNVAKHVYVQVHDLSIIKDTNTGDIIKSYDNLKNLHLDSDFVTIVALNEWHKSNLLAQYKVPSERIICVPNGVDLSLFDFSDCEKDHRVLWSSCQERGLDILINDVYPLVKAHVPDFGIDVAGYNELHDINTDGKDIRILGRLTKQQLYAEQKKHRVWFYPGTFAETFCITMIENILNGAQVVSPMTFGTSGTLAPFLDKIKMQGDFISGINDIAAVEAAFTIIRLLNGDSSKDELYKQITEYIKDNYNWYHSVDLYEKDFTKYMSFTSGDERGDKPKKILFLTMLCNHPYFKDELEIVKDTWAKPIIEGKYSDATWYSFTACDKEHPIECVDPITRMVYVNTQDDLYHTFSKMKRAYQLLREAEDFDVLVRTNTSTYLNLDKVMHYARTIGDNEIANDFCNYYFTKPDGSWEFQFVTICGNCYVGPTVLFDKVFFSEHNEDTMHLHDGDDIITAKILYHLGVRYKSIRLNPCERTNNYCPLYKRYAPEDAHLASDEESNRYTDDPYEVHNFSTVSVRSKYVNLDERRKKGNEFEHMYELDRAYRRVSTNNKKHFKILFLSMSCNDEFFTLEESVVKDTWAKPIIEGKYPDVGFFSYKSCNKKYHFECIADNTVYVNVMDDLHHTYSKTKRALQFLEEQGYSWDYLVRTNTSTYWNVQKVVDFYPQMCPNFIYSVFGWQVPFDGSGFDCPAGWSMILPKNLTDIIAHEDFDETMGKYKATIGDRINNKSWFPYERYDDTLIGLLIWLVRDRVKYNYFNMGVYHYRCIPDGVLQIPKMYKGHPFFDRPEERLEKAEDINNVFMAQVRSWGIKECRYLELEHMYELDNAIKRKI